MFYNGMEIVESNYLVKEIKIRVKRHKKKRIDKKWLKRYGYNVKTVPKRDLIIFQNKIIGHPDTIKKLKEQIRNK